MNMPMLFAAGLDWLEALLPLLFVLFWILSQVVNVIRAVGKAAQPKPPPALKPVVDPDVVEARRDLERQLEEFLRRGGGREIQPPPAPAPRQQKSRQQAQRGDQRRGNQQRPTRPRDASAQPPVAAVLPPDRGLGALGGHATEVARHVDEAFAHDLQHRTGADAAAGTPTPHASLPSTVGRDLAATLREPASLRRLILLQEVLERPVERW